MADQDFVITLADYTCQRGCQFCGGIKRRGKPVKPARSIIVRIQQVRPPSQAA